MFTPVIIGSSGWVASAAQHHFADRHIDFEAPIIFGSREGWSNICRTPILSLDSQPSVIRRTLLGKSLVVFHFAYLTQEKIGADQAGYIDAITSMNKKVISIIENYNVAAFVYASSGAATLANDPINRGDTGKILYGKLKAFDEQMFGDICREKGVKYLAPRIFSLAGPFINKHSTYAISDMILQAKRIGQIKLHANKPVWRSYVDVIDFVTVLSHAITKYPLSAKKSPVFDVAHTVNVEIEELAFAVASHFGLPKKAVIRANLTSLHAADLYLGCGSQFLDMGKVCGVNFIELPDMVQRTAQYLEEIYGS